MSLKITALLASAAVMAMATPAAAETYVFTLSGQYASSWLLDSNPSPDQVGTDSFVTYNVLGDFTGLPDNSEAGKYRATIQFFTSANDGGFTIFDQSTADFDDPEDLGTPLLTTSSLQLFTGTTLNPSFLTGTFQLTNIDSEESGLSLSIQPLAASAAPEPATWAMMIAGFGMVGGALRTRKKVRFQQAVA